VDHLARPPCCICLAESLSLTAASLRISPLRTRLSTSSSKLARPSPRTIHISNVFVGYGSGSQIIDLNGNDPYIVSESTGKNFRYWRGRVRDNEVLEKTNKAVVSAGTVIATLTSAGGSFDRAVCEFTVSWSDLPFPTAVGIAKFMVSVMKEGANYRSAVSSVVSAYASNGGAGVPTFTLSLVGNVWSLTMTPLDGDLTVHTITAEMQNIVGITLALP
jgi:hypothetical protein